MKRDHWPYTWPSLQGKIPSPEFKVQTACMMKYPVDLEALAHFYRPPLSLTFVFTAS